MNEPRLSYSEVRRRDALFHYTTATGDMGILASGQLSSTAYYCANDESELTAGKGTLARTLRSATNEMIDANDAIAQAFRTRGYDMWGRADEFEDYLVSLSLGPLCAYITCFCQATGEEDFRHGLLSQWRGYGTDGGYAIQFSRRRLQETFRKVAKHEGLVYQLQDVYYSGQNPLRLKALQHADAFIKEYKEYLSRRLDGAEHDGRKVYDPIPNLSGGPLESLLQYLVHTKNKHFAEERECRLSVVQAVAPEPRAMPVQHFSRAGMVVPYIETPQPSLDVLRTYP